MKSFKQYLIESNTSDLGEISELIKRDCQPFLTQCGGELIYRGMESKTPFMTKDVRKNRQPMNLKQTAHELIDNTMYEKHGIRGRSGAVFCTGNTTTARGYGAVYAIFPIGDFKFIWSPVVEDFYFDMGEPIKMLTKRNGALVVAKRRYYVENFINLSGVPFDGDADTPFIDKLGMMRSELKKDFDTNKKYQDAFKEVFEEFIENEYQTDDLVSAIKSKKEIMIECDKYYAVELKHAVRMDLWGSQS